MAPHSLTEVCKSCANAQTCDDYTGPTDEVFQRWATVLSGSPKRPDDSHLPNDQDHAHCP
jgi:hypothetical protein